MRLFDTHTHLLDTRFDADREAIVARFPDNGIACILEASTRARDAARVLQFAHAHDRVAVALGTHPHDAADMREADMAALRLALKDEKAVAVGEMGLDYHYDFSPREIQRHWFARQLDLAAALRLPAVIHVREADADALDILRAHKDGLTGVMHCFSGSYETACACLDLGLYIAFGGALTFKNARRNVEVAQRLPMDRLLIETDCPYMAPHPLRAKRNEPALVRLVCERLAQIKGLSVEETGEITYQNGLRLFSPPHLS